MRRGFNENNESHVEFKNSANLMKQSHGKQEQSKVTRWIAAIIDRKKLIMIAEHESDLGL